MADIPCPKDGAVENINTPAVNSCPILDKFDEAMSEVTVKELSSGDIVFYRPPTADNDSPVFNDETCAQVFEVPNFEKIAEVLNPFLDDFRFSQHIEATAEKSFSGDLFIDPVEYIVDEYSLGFEKPDEDPFDSFSDISDFTVPDIVPPAPPKLPGDLTLEDFTDDLSEEAKAQTKQEFFEDTFKPVKHEPMLSKSEKTVTEPIIIDDSKCSSISAAGWLGIILLLLIPGINLILLIIWACGCCQKKAKASFARAALLVLLIFAVIIAVAWFAFGNAIYGAVQGLLVKNGSPSELTLGIFGAIQDAVKFFGIDLTITPVINV